MLPDDATAGQAGAGGGEASQGGDAALAGAPSAGAGQGPSTREYPNLFADLLGKTEAELTAKLEHDYEQLFHGDPDTESIFVQVDATHAYVWDPRQGDVRSDAFGNALLVSVQLDRRTEFDQLWRWADEHLVLENGPLRDYVRVACDTDGAVCEATVATEPHFAAATALWLADGRWGSSGSLDYAQAAARLTEAVFRIEPGASTSRGELVGLVDEARHLPLATPYLADAQLTRTAAMAPAYFGLWAEKTGDGRALELASNARTFLEQVADPDTGLVPDRAELDGSIPAEEVFSANSYPVLLAVPLDASWFAASARHAALADRWLEFFRPSLTQGAYASSYSLSGEPGAPLGDVLSLQAPLAASALAASVAFRAEYVQAVWESQLNTGTSRKFGNLLYLMSTLQLGGRFRVY